MARGTGANDAVALSLSSGVSARQVSQKTLKYSAYHYANRCYRSLGLPDRAVASTQRADASMKRSCL